LVSHELDGDWQFIGDEPAIDYMTTGKVVGLNEIIKKDKSILKVADLPKGYQATRKDKNHRWEIFKIEYSDEEIAEMGYICSQCGELHKEIPMAYASDAPYQYFQIALQEQASRCTLNEETCIIDDIDFYIRGQLNIKVDNSERFCWGVWVKITEEDYIKITEMWNEENRFLVEAISGKLATLLICYPDTIDLDVKIQIQQIPIRPEVEVVYSSHPLFVEQESGIDMARVTDFARYILHQIK